MTTPTFTMPVDTPVGRLVLESDGDVLVGIWLPTSGMKARGDGRDAPPVLKEAARQLEEYFGRERTAFDIPMELDGTDFQREVWAELSRKMCIRDRPSGAPPSSRSDGRWRWRRH